MELHSCFTIEPCSDCKRTSIIFRVSLHLMGLAVLCIVLFLISGLFFFLLHCPQPSERKFY